MSGLSFRDFFAISHDEFHDLFHTFSRLFFTRSGAEYRGTRYGGVCKHYHEGGHCDGGFPDWMIYPEKLLLGRAAVYLG